MILFALVSGIIAIVSAQDDNVNLVRNGDMAKADNRRVMKDWVAYKHANVQGGLHHALRTTKWGFEKDTYTAHLHGGCGSSSGGMSQTINLEKGTQYVLVFTGFSGDWEARDTDTMSWGVTGTDLGEQEEGFQDAASVQRGRGKTITNTFTATASAGMVYFWSDAGNCNDVTAVSITKVITTNHSYNNYYDHNNHGIFNYQYDRSSDC